MIYTCKICKRALDTEQEDVHVTPKEEGIPGYDAYCFHCWSEWNRFVGNYGLNVIEEE